MWLLRRIHSEKANLRSLDFYPKEITKYHESQNHTCYKIRSTLTEKCLFRTI